MDLNVSSDLMGLRAIRDRMYQILNERVALGEGGAKRRRMIKCKNNCKKKCGGVRAGKKPKKRVTKRAGVKAGAKRSKSSPWIAHVKAYSKKHNISYGDALKKAGPSYKK